MMKVFTKVLSGVFAMLGIISIFLESDLVMQPVFNAIGVVVCMGLATFFFNPICVFSAVYAFFKTAGIILYVNRNDLWDELDEQVKLRGIFDMYRTDYEYAHIDWF